MRSSLFRTAREMRAARKTKTMQPSPAFRRYWPVLRLLLFLVMLLAPELPERDTGANAPAAQPAFASDSM